MIQMLDTRRELGTITGIPRSDLRIVQAGTADLVIGPNRLRSL
jgi:hypothetical protein